MWEKIYKRRVSRLTGYTGRLCANTLAYDIFNNVVSMVTGQRFASSHQGRSQ